VDGKLIRIRIPELTEERRRELVKATKGMAEETKVRIRGARRDALDQLKKLQKDGKITEDDLRSLEKEVQDYTDKAVKRVDDALAAKEAEILKV